MHGYPSQRILSNDPRAARIAELSHEFLTAAAARREEIGTEISAIILGNVVPLVRPT